MRGWPRGTERPATHNEQLNVDELRIGEQRISAGANEQRRSRSELRPTTNNQQPTTATDVLPIALTIAGSDSGGGAGIQADLKTFQAFGVFGTSAVTAVTAQNTRGVTAVHAIPAEVVRAQVHAVATDFEVAACKTGMLATRELVQLVA